MDIPSNTLPVTRPQKLNPGDRVALVSPGWGGAFHYPKILDLAVENLKTVLNVEVTEFPSARADSAFLHKNPKFRADDINKAFADDSVDAIFSVIGGNDSIRILEYLDVDLIMNNPKIIMGFSDTTAILSYLNQYGLATFYGPSMMAGWAQVRNFPFLKEYYQNILLKNPDRLELKAFPQWSSGYPSWDNPENYGKVSGIRQNTEGNIWLQGTGVKSGRLWGGCIEVLDWLKGTRYWPQGNFWNNRILFLETSEEKPAPRAVGYSLRNLGVQGIFDKINGILVGRARDYSDEEKQELNDVIIDTVAKEFGATNIPVVANMCFGHTDPNLILPLGIEYEIDSDNKCIRQIECSFA